MDKEEARGILAQQIARLRQLSHGDLQRYVKDEEHMEVKGESGAEYQVEVQSLWDEGRPGGNLRVMVSIDDGGLRAIFPLSEDFIIAPDGSFVGEQA
jgi:hypothetical protein